LGGGGAELVGGDVELAGQLAVSEDLHGLAEMLEDARLAERLRRHGRAVLEAIERREVDRLVLRPPLVVEAAEDVELPGGWELATFELVVGAFLAAARALALEAAAGIGAGAARVAPAHALLRVG